MLFHGLNCVWENPNSGVEAKEPLFCEPRSSLLSKSYWHTRLICPLILSTRSGQISGEISPAAAGRSKNFPHPSTQKPLFVASPVQQIFCQWTEWLDSNDRWSWRGLCRLPPIPSRHTFQLRIWSISIQDRRKTHLNIWSCMAWHTYIAVSFWAVFL